VTFGSWTSNIVSESDHFCHEVGLDDSAHSSVESRNSADKDASLDTHMVELNRITSLQRKLFEAHWEAVKLCQQIEGGEVTVEYVNWPDEDDLRLYLLGVYRFMVPEGIAQRGAENGEHEAQLEEEEREMEVNRLGHLFTYDRGEFWQRTRICATRMQPISGSMYARMKTTIATLWCSCMCCGNSTVNPETTSNNTTCTILVTQ
jgi:hypothetical protein